MGITFGIDADNNYVSKTNGKEILTYFADEGLQFEFVDDISDEYLDEIIWEPECDAVPVDLRQEHLEQWRAHPALSLNAFDAEGLIMTMQEAYKEIANVIKTSGTSLKSYVAIKELRRLTKLLAKGFAG